MQTSAKQIDQEIIDHIENQFYKALTMIKSEAQMKAFLTAFLSETEQTVMHKRFAILSMLAGGKSYTAIENELKVSSATVSSISKLSQEEAIQTLLKELAAEEWATDMSAKFFDKLPKLFKKKEKKTDVVASIVEAEVEEPVTAEIVAEETETQEPVVTTINSETPQTV